MIDVYFDFVFIIFLTSRDSRVAVVRLQMVDNVTAGHALMQ